MMKDNDTAMEDATAAMDISGTNYTTSANDTEPTTMSTTTGTTSTEQTQPVDEDDDDDTTAMMDEINNDDGVDEDDDDDGDDKKESSDPAETDKTDTSDETLVCRAIGLKEEGNKQFQSGDFNQASRAYRRGINALKKVKNQLDDQVKVLKVTLYTNWSTVSYKDVKYRISLDMATKAVEIDGINVKALYRRAMAHRKLGNLDSARNDLRHAITFEPNNTACRKELIAVKKELDDAVAKQKKSFAKAFDSTKNGSSFLYDDKEELAKQREIERQRKLKEEEELKAKHRKQWEDECVGLMAKNETVPSFEEWDKQRQEKEDEEKKKEEKQRKAERKARASKEQRAKSSIDKFVCDRDKERADDDDDDDIQFTEAELAMMRGYKKTSDGRTTSYFTRELSQEEKLQIGDIAPKRLDTTNISNTSLPTLQQLSDNSSSSSPATALTGQNSNANVAASVWNQAGTWEEKNTTEWCTMQLKQRLLETIAADATLCAKITAVEDLTGDASVVVVSCKKRYIFDFHVKLKYEVYNNVQSENQTDMNDDATKVIASGTMRLPDICSTHHEEVEVICENYKKKPAAHLLDHVTTIRKGLVDNVRIQITFFVQDFNSTY
jgi:tetratricopeptide (TPR) repeat protein